MTRFHGADLRWIGQYSSFDLYRFQDYVEQRQYYRDALEVREAFSAEGLLLDTSLGALNKRLSEDG
jgi:hypothetical protein